MDEKLQRARRIAAADPSIENLAALGAAYLRSSSQRHTIRVDGRRWFQKSAGNTYHTVRVYVDGELVGESGRHYGYGDQYRETGLEIALAALDLPPRFQYDNGGYEAWYQWAERNNVELDFRVIDVPRQRDL